MSFDIYYQQYLYVFLLCFARNLSLVYFFYVTNKLATTLKTILALILACLSFYMNSLFLITWNEFITLAISNIIIGFAISFVLSIPFYLIEMNGSLVDNFRGETVASSFTSSFINRKSSVYNLLNMAFLTYFICCNGLYLFMKIIFLSYAALPIKQPLSNLLLSNVVSVFNHLLLWFGVISFPAISMSMLVDIIFAFSAVVVPNLNTFFLGFPIKSMVLILLYLFLTPTLFFYMMKYFSMLVLQIGLSF